MKRKNKKAQFYLIAAVIIAIIVLGMASVSNYIIVQEEPVEFYDLGENLGLEGSWVIDHGIYNKDDVNQRIIDFARNYSEYILKTGEDFELAIIYGDTSNGYARTYKRKLVGTIGSELGSVPNYEVEETNIGSITNTDTIKVSNTSYPVNLGENQNFLFVMTTSKGFEKHVYERTE